MVTPKLKHVSITLDDIIESNYRLEAQVFNIDAIQAKEQLEACRWDIRTVGGPDGLATAYHRPRFKRIYVERSHYPIFQPSQITEIYPKPLLYISDKTDTEIAALRVKRGQILMTCSGTVGKCTIVSDTLDNHIFSHDLLRITANRFEDTGYLYAFFISKMGQLLLTTSNYGAVIQHIEPEHLDAVPVPVPPEPIRDAIHALIMESFALREESNRLIDEAERLLVEALQLPPIEEMEPVNFNSEIGFQNYQVTVDKLDLRLDGSYHIPITKCIIDAMEEHAREVKPLGEVSNAITMPGIFKRIYVEPEYGVPFIGTKEMKELKPDVQKFLSKTFHAKLIRDHLELKENMILQSNRGSRSVGDVVMVPRHFVENHYAASQNCLRIIADDEIAGYIYIFLNSVYGNILSRREIYGATIDMIDHRNCASIPVPLLHDEGIQQQINDLALKANKLRSEAYYKEQEALEKLESLFDE